MRAGKSTAERAGLQRRLARRYSVAAAVAASVAGLWLMPCMAATQRPPVGVEEALARIAAVADAPASTQAAQALWRMPLDAPVIVHDRASGSSWRRDSGTGAALPVVLRNDQPPANTCITIDGAPAVLLLLPLPGDRDGLATLFWHEQWHCVQAALGLPAAEGDTAHLDGEAGRTALRLEMRALAQALSTRDEHQARQHAAAALGYRALRADAAAPRTRALEEEAKVERNEGLADYTGRAIAAATHGGDATAAAVGALAKADASQSFVRSAAYVTGPAYGLLLDRWSPAWRRGVSAGTTLPALLADALGVTWRGAGIAQNGAGYGVDEVRAEERERAKERERRSAGYRERFLGNDAVRLPLRNPSISFDPRSLFPLDDAGTVYTPLTVRDEWGELTAVSGGLLSKDWALLSVSGGVVDGAGSRWTGPGWTLVLGEGWRLERGGDGWGLTKGLGLGVGDPGDAGE